MEIILTLSAGFLIACGLYAMMREGMVRVILGIMLMGHGANLMLFSTGDLKMGGLPIIPKGMTEVVGEVSDPISQAIVLNAIIIGFGVTAFVLILFYRTYKTVGSHEMADYSHSEDLAGEES